jgi:hypothetical protein
MLLICCGLSLSLVPQSRRTQGSSSTNQSQEFTGAAFIELRVRIIQWEAATLGKRVILTAVAGAIALLIAMVRTVPFTLILVPLMTERSK